VIVTFGEPDTGEVRRLRLSKPSDKGYERCSERELGSRMEAKMERKVSP
jgi:hypothetical protein